MANDLTIRRTLNQIQPCGLGRSLDVEIALAMNADAFGTGIIPADRMPSDVVKAKLRERREQLEAYLAPHVTDDVLLPLQELFIVLASRTGSDRDGKIRLLAYSRELADLPAWAIIQACDAFKKGRVGDGVWAPTPAQIRAEVERYLAPWNAEVSRIETVLAFIPESSPTGKASIAKRAEEVIAELTETTQRLDGVRENIKTEFTKSEAETWLAGELANPKPLPKLSESALKRMA